MTDRERAMEEARKLTPCGCVTCQEIVASAVDALLEAEARGVEFALDDYCASDDVARALRVERAAALRAAKGGA